MNRNEALKFIRDNSRSVFSMCSNPVPINERHRTYEAAYLEQRVGNNGEVFFLHDYGSHGWNIYFPVSGNNVDTSIEEFCRRTGLADTPPHEPYSKELSGK